MLKDEQPEMILLVGIPGSGKSTYVKKLIASGNDYTIISTDDIIEREAQRQGKTYTDLWKQMIDQATAQSKDEFRQAVKNRENIIWDQTNLTSGKRKSILSQLPKNYYKVAVLFNVPLDEIKNRVEKREKETGKHIPLNVIQDMYNRLEVPTVQEGFDEIVLV